MERSVSDRDRWLEEIRAADLGESEAAISALVRTTIDLAPRSAGPSDRAVGATRLFGIPDLPPGQEWPRAAGIPLPCVAQVNLASVSAADEQRQLPPRGFLWFFMAWTEDGEVGRVLFADVEPADLAPAELPPELSEPPVLGVDIAPVIELPPYSSQFVAIPEFSPSPPRVPLPRELHARYGGVYNRWLKERRERPWNAMLGFDRAMEAILRPDETMLLRLEHEEEVSEFFEGEVSCIFFEIDDAALARRDFTRARARYGSSI